MHHLACADDRIDRTGGQAQRATDAGVLINDGDGRWLSQTMSRVQGNDLDAEQSGECGDGFISARWTLVDRCCTRGNGLGIGPATGMTTLTALCLR